MSDNKPQGLMRTALSRVTEDNRRVNRSVPLSDTEWEDYKKASDLAGKPRTVWLRELGNAEADRLLNPPEPAPMSEDKWLAETLHPDADAPEGEEQRLRAGFPEAQEPEPEPEPVKGLEGVAQLLDV